MAKKEEPGCGLIVCGAVIFGLILWLIAYIPWGGREATQLRHQEADRRISEGELQVKAKEMLALRVFDPDSLRTRDVFVNGESVCGWYNAKNLFGAYIGYRRFYYNEQRGLETMALAVQMGMEDMPSDKSDASRVASYLVFKEEDDPETFATYWETQCLSQE